MNSNYIHTSSELDMLSVVIDQELETIKNYLEEVISRWFLSTNNATLIRNFVSPSALVFEVGIIDPEESIIDSEIRFQFDKNNCYLEICPNLSNKFNSTDNCKIEQIKLLNHVIENIDKINEELVDIVNSNSFNSYVNNIKNYKDITDELMKLKQEQYNCELEKISSQLTKGDKLSYIEGMSTTFMLFNSYKYEWCIYKVCDKTLKIISNEGTIKQLDKANVVKLIYDNIIIKEHKDE